MLVMREKNLYAILVPINLSEMLDLVCVVW